VRAQIVRWLQRRPVNQEWVYNGADLQNSNIIWARETGDESDLQLLEHYSDRHAWLLEADVYPQRVVPYPVADATAIRAGTDSLGYVRQ
jgi:hypothetical protein